MRGIPTEIANLEGIIIADSAAAFAMVINTHFENAVLLPLLKRKAMQEAYFQLFSVDARRRELDTIIDSLIGKVKKIKRVSIRPVSTR